MSKKIILIILILVIFSILNSGCGRIIRKSWNPYGWDFQIEGIDEVHRIGGGFLVRDDMFELNIENYPKNYNFESTQISLISKYYFERGKSYEVELIINNENVEGGRYQLTEDEGKIKVIKQSYFTGTNAIFLPPYFEYQHETISWEVEFISSNNDD